MNGALGPSLFEYLDFREFLRDYCEFQKKSNPAFSHRNFAKAAGIPASTATILSSVIKGTRKLSQSYMIKFAIGLKLGDRESRFFKNLVQFNQSKTMEEKNYFFSQIAKVRGSRAAILKEGQSVIYSKWYYTVVWNYLNMNPTETNPNTIAKKIYPPLNPEQVKDAVDLLVKLNLVKKMANGYAPTHKHLTTEKEVKALFAKQYLQELIGMSSQMLNDVPQDKRQYNAFVFSISKEGFNTIKERMRSFQEELREIIERDEKEDRIYSLTMQLFPNSKF